MINLNGSLIIQIANFIFLIFILNLVLYRPIRNILLQRKEKIKGFEDTVQNVSKSLQEKEDAFAEGIKKARIKGQQEREAMIALANDEEKQIVAEINRKAQADLAALRDKIAVDAESVRGALSREIDGFASKICQKILGRAV